MKIRDLILAVLVLGMVVSTGVLVAFASIGIADVKDTTSSASSEELLGIAAKNLEDIAVNIRDSLDNQMQIKYEMVKTWAQDPTLLDVARQAQSRSGEELFEMWSAKDGRQYDGSLAAGDGKPDNDLSPAASKYLARLADITGYQEISLTDSRGYTIAANAAIGDFDQGPEDWGVYMETGGAVYKQISPSPGGEDWYQAAIYKKDGFYTSEIIWDENIEKWVMELVSQVKDPATGEYLGLMKVVFDYGAFVAQFVNVKELDVYEVKLADVFGTIVATSLEDKSKINNPSSNLNEQFVFKMAIATGLGNTPESYVDENGQTILAGYAKSRDYNRHIVMVTKKISDIAAPIEKFTSGLQTSIGEKGSALQRNMIIIGAAVAIIIILLAAFIMRAKVAIPLKKLTGVSEKLSKGEIDGLQIDLKGKDEISSFGESFKGVLAAFNFLKEEAEKKS
jgi:hypothetical protein